jgi:hypothetical protein
MKILDTVAPFAGLHGNQAKMRLRIWKTLANGFFVVLFTELTDNPGVSVTNWSEHLATGALHAFEYLTPHNVIWAENYQEDMESQEPFKQGSWDRFSQIMFTYDPKTENLTNPTWQRLTREKLAELVGEDVDLVEA